MTVWPVTTGQEFWSVSIKSLSHIHINKRTEHLNINNFIFILNGRCSVLMITDHGMECQCTVIPLNPKPFEQIESRIIKLEANKVSSKPQWKTTKKCVLLGPLDDHSNTWPSRIDIIAVWSLIAQYLCIPCSRNQQTGEDWQTDGEHGRFWRTCLPLSYM